MRPAQDVGASRPLRRFKASGWPVPDPRKPSLVPGAISGRGRLGGGAPQVGPADYLAVLPTGARRADNNLVSSISMCICKLWTANLALWSAAGTSSEHSCA